MSFEKVSSKSSKAGKFKHCPDMCQFNICRPDICWLDIIQDLDICWLRRLPILAIPAICWLSKDICWFCQKIFIYWFRLISHKISKKVKNMPKGTIWKSNESLKMVSKMAHHFIYGHPSRKQTVTLYLKDSIIAVQDFREKRKYSIKVRKTF